MSKTSKTTIFIADDHALVRDGLSAIIGFQDDLKLVGEAQDGIEAVASCKKLKPDVAIIDLMMPRMNGAAAIEKIKAETPRTQILVLTSYTDAADLSLALDNGASGAISKTAPKEVLFDAIRRIASGERVIAPEFANTLSENREKADELSDRQREILESLARGLTNADIAHQYDTTLANVKFHLLTIFRKLGAANRTEAVTIALRKHLLKT